MKKLIIILTIGALLSSCGSGSIDISKIDSPCACAEAAVTVMKKLMPYKDQMKGLNNDDAKVFMKENGLDELYSQMNDLDKKCRGDLSFRKVESDCSAKYELKDLKEKFK